MKDLIKWWLDYKKLSDEEKNILNITRPEEIIFNNSFDVLEQEYFQRIPFGEKLLNTHQITFDYSATDLIKKIFKENVDDDTLVIYSMFEHPAALEEIKKCKNKFELTNHGHILPIKISDVIQESKKYKKVFIYIIGTQITTGEITPQLFYKKLSDELNINNIPFKMTIDDVHGMFLTPRDYSIFDYAIFTAHALIRGYDMGILISKKSENIGYKAYNWGNTYLKLLDIILKRFDKITYFRTVMTEYFADYLALDDYSLFERTCNHIFSIKCSNHNFTQSMAKQLEKYEIWLEGLDAEIQSFRFRGQQYIKNPELFLEGIETMKQIITLSEGMI